MALTCRRHSFSLVSLSAPSLGPPAQISVPSPFSQLPDVPSPERFYLRVKKKGNEICNSVPPEDGDGATVSIYSYCFVLCFEINFKKTLTCSSLKCKGSFGYFNLIQTFESLPTSQILKLILNNYQVTFDSG